MYPDAMAALRSSRIPVEGDISRVHLQSEQGIEGVPVPDRSTISWNRGGPLLAASALTSLLAACTLTPSGTLPKALPSPGKAGGAAIVSKGGGNIVSKGGGNIVPNGGGNIVPNGGGNIVPNGGGNIVPNGGGNIVPNGGGNIVPNGGGNIIPNGGGSFTGPHATFAVQLRDLAAIGHTRAAAQIISNNGARVVSNNAGAILANNASGLLANNAAGVMSNNGGQAISNGGAAFRLAQLAPPAFSLAPATGETVPQEIALPDGTTAVAFDRADGTQRIVVVNAERRPLEQVLVSQIANHADGSLRSSHTERQLVYGGDQRRRGFLAYDELYNEAGQLLSLTHAPSELEEPNSKLKIVVEKLKFTVEPPAGEFSVRFEHLGAVEQGTFSQVVRNVADRGVGVDLADPLATLGGASRFTTNDGTLLFERRTTIAGSEHQLRLTLRDGYALELARASRTVPYQGKLTLNGAPIGQATLTTRADASVTYVVTFDDATPPLQIDIPDPAPDGKAP